MLNPWKTTSPKEEPELLEIMSEQLNQRFQIEDDFVWVDLPEAQKVKDVVASSKSYDVSPALLSNVESSIAQNDRKVVQSEVAVDVNISYEEVTEKNYYDEGTEIFATDIEEELDEVDDWECKIDYKRPVNTQKAVYPMPQWWKRREHSTPKVTSSENKIQNAKNVNPLLPKIKFGPSTTAVLERLIDKRYLGQYNEVIGRGKNSILFHAPCHRRNCIVMPFDNAVKVYKLCGNKEKNRMIFERVQREFEHMRMVWNHGYKHIDTGRILPACAQENVIVMACLDTTRTPSIQDLPLQEDVDTRLYLTIVSFMHRCYNVLHLVHGKLGVKNIRCSGQRPCFIGWGHSVKTSHPSALTKLIKDCQFVSQFYAKRGVNVKSTEDLFKDITGCMKISSKLLDVINTRDLYDRYDQNPNRRSLSPNKPNNNLRFKCNS